MGDDVNTPRSTKQVQRRARERVMSIIKRDMRYTDQVGHLRGSDVRHLIIDYHGVLAPACNPFPRGTARELIIDDADVEATCKRCG